LAVKELIQDSLKGDERALNGLCEELATFARAYLRQKKSLGNLMHTLYPNLDGLAVDCIASLFNHSDDRLLKLRRYFEDKALDALDDSDCLIHLRRLSMSLVNQGIYDNFKQIDPSLAKIIRNIKGAIKQESDWVSYHPDTKEIQFGEANNVSVLIPEELLEIKVEQRWSRQPSIKHWLQAGYESLGDQWDYSSCYPLIGFAFIIRTLSVKLAIQDHIEVDPVKLADVGYLTQVVHQSVFNVFQSIRESYIKAGKMGAKEIDTYEEIVKSILVHTFVEGNEHAESQYEHCTHYMPGLEYEEFRTSVRKRLEYFIQLCREAFVDSVRKDNKKSAQGSF
jgi:hypothetical protein